MYKVSKYFHDAVYRGETPCIYVVIASDRGNHIFAEKVLGGVFATEPLGFQGTGIENSLVDGSGNLNAIEISDRLINAGILERSIQPKTRDVINSLTNKERQNITVELDNHDYKLSKDIVLDPWLTKILMVYAGFEVDTLANQIRLFMGRITEIELNRTSLFVCAEEL